MSVSYNQGKGFLKPISIPHNICFKIYFASILGNILPGNIFNVKICMRSLEKIAQWELHSGNQALFRVVFGEAVRVLSECNRGCDHKVKWIVRL